MSNPELIRQLAHLRKMGDQYVDYKGQLTTVPLEYKELLLQAMGYALDDDAALHQAITELDQKEWMNVTQPVYVLRPHLPMGVEISVPSDQAHSQLFWQIILEGGEVMAGQQTEPAHLELRGYRELSGRTFDKRFLALPDNLPLGYHTLVLELPGHTLQSTLIVTPATSFQNEAIARGDNIWGTAIQLYTLKSDRNWGMGDFTDLAQLIKDMSAAGADFIGLNPIHALYPISAEHASPYSPSDRAFINVMYVDPEQVPEFAESATLKTWLKAKDTQAQLKAVRATADVDYTQVSALKYQAFDALFEVFEANHWGQGTQREEQFKAFAAKGGQELHEHCLFEALLKHFKALDINAWGWPKWPEAFQDVKSAEVKAFAAENEQAIRYFMYLQFLADEQLEAVNQLTQSEGMKLGLYRDLAVGADRGGAEVWSNKNKFCLEASVGAPPDALGPVGQNWGLPPLEPIGLKAEGYQAFINLVRSNMHGCGALRIDHAMALFRLWWCPPGKTAAEGCYIHYDFEDLLGILLLESQRNQCLVIAEDLGTVPPEVMKAFPRAELFSNKVFYFEFDENGCTPPNEYAPKALAIVANHDMPTVKAYWNLTDLDLRKTLGMFTTEAVFQTEREGRETCKEQILEALDTSGRLPKGMSLDPAKTPEMTLELCQAIHCQLASGQSQIMAIQLEDFMLINKPVNVPGTSDEYANWRRKLDEDSTTLFNRPEIQAFCAALNRERAGK